MLTDASIYDDNMTLLQAYRNLAKRVKALEESGGGGGGSYVLPVASETTLGGIKVGEGLGINRYGYLFTTGGGGYTLPTASEEVKGGVRIGSGLQMDGEVLSVVGGATGGGKEIVVDRHNIGSPVIGASSYTEGFLIGTCIGIRVPLKDYTTPLTFVNTEDDTDTKTLYIQNTSYVSNTLLYLSNITGDYDIVINKGNGYLENSWGRGWRGGFPSDLVLFDTDAQGSATPVAQWVGVNGQGAYVRINTDSNNRFYAGQAQGTITQLTTEIEDGGSWKQYKWEGSLNLSDIIQTGSDAFAYLLGTWLCQRDIT